jgi:hypothetical protein
MTFTLHIFSVINFKKQKKNMESAYILKTNNWNITLETTTELSCILNIRHAMDNVQCNIGTMNQPLL